MSETKTTQKRKAVAEKQTVIRVANTDIILGTTYEVIGKKDLDAPDGFQAYNTTKLLMEGIEEIHSVPFNEETRRWDTGFELNSACNFTMPKADKDALIKAYNTHIKKPYEAFYQVDTDATNNDFWGGNDGLKIPPYFYKIRTGKTFDTSRPDELFDLFHALKQGVICEAGEKDPILQRKAKYCVRNREKLISLQEEKQNNKFDAIATFATLVNTLDPEKDDTLYCVLEWMQVSQVRNSDLETLKRSVMKLFESEKTGYDNAKKFLEAYEMTKDPTTKNKMDVFSMLTQLHIKQKLEYKRQQYYLENTLLGNHLKGAAQLAVDNPEIKDLIVECFEKYCTK